MAQSLEDLSRTLATVLEAAVLETRIRRGEISVTLAAAGFADAMALLRDHEDLGFAQLTDCCGMDYSAYGGGGREGPRYGVVYHLLSVVHNHRLRVHVSPPDDEYPVIASVIGVWPSANWYEREAFDLFGIVFEGHPDLRRILTDYGFVGHPFRKDFPVSGNVEMRYDPEQQRVVYQPVSIEPREIVPRIIREEQYGAAE